MYWRGDYYCNNTQNPDRNPGIKPLSKVALGISWVSPFHVYLLLFASFWFIFTQLTSQPLLPHHDHHRPISMYLHIKSAPSFKFLWERRKIFPAQCLFASCTVQVTPCGRHVYWLLLDQACRLGRTQELARLLAIGMVVWPTAFSADHGEGSPPKWVRKTMRYSSYLA